MNTKQLQELRMAVGQLLRRAAGAALVLGKQCDRDAVPELEPGAVVTFRHRGKELTGQLGQVRGEELYVYVDNEDGFGTSGYRTTKARLVYPEVELDSAVAAEVCLLAELVGVHEKRGK